MREGQNIREVEALGIDWMGFICAPRSPRYVGDKSPEYLPRIQRVGVFVNPSLEFIGQKVTQLGLTKLQLHGQETIEFCRQAWEAFRLPLLKVISISTAADLANTEPYQSEPSVEALLFDTRCEGDGGSGKNFAWDILSHYTGQKPFLLAGGISPGDETDLFALHHPKMMGIDLNSRFEVAPAKKDTLKLKTFIQNIRKKYE